MVEGLANLDMDDFRSLSGEKAEVDFAEMVMGSA